MTPERWQEVQNLFSRAVDQSPAQRANFLADACAGDPQLLAEVQSLVRAHCETTAMLEVPVLGRDFRLPDPERLMDGAGAGPAPERVGAYRLGRLIGSGGMGAVYLADREDGHYRQQVALKLIRFPHDGDSLLERFYQERQLLAELNHAHIARLLDGGSTPEGLPYLVMEYIDGMAIDKYCDHHGLSIAARLQLFRQVCAAVHYAHQNLVVHCDLKPSNILVTPQGVPKLLDFGIAKMLKSAAAAGEGHASTVPVTLMTPDYASPEHVRGSHVSICSDVYSLGVVLYELLTGRRPFRLRTRVRVEIEQAVCETEPLKPSVAARRLMTDSAAAEATIRTRGLPPARLSKRLDGDLDTIALKALRKEPQRRYPSVEQLSEDIRRHLVGLPVLARKDTVGYLASKFVRRHKLAVITAGVVLFSLLAGLVAIQRQARITTRQRDLAEANLQRALQAESQYAAQAEAARKSAETARTTARQARILNVFLQSMLSAADPYHLGKDTTVLEVLDRASEWVGTGLSSEPPVEAALRQTIGNAYRNLGVLDAAEHHLQAAVALFEDQAPQTDAARESLARGVLDLAAVLQDRGDYAGAELLYRRALETYRALHGDDHLDVVSALTYLAVLLDEKGDRKAAVSFYDEASSIYAALLDETSPPDSRQVAEDYSHLASLLQYQGDWKRAERLLRQTLSSQLELYGNKHPKVADSLYNLAVFLQDKGALARAKLLHQQALSMRRALLGEKHPRVADSLEGLATIYYEQGDYAGAEQQLWQAYEIREQVVPGGHPDISRTLVLLGTALLERGAPAIAEPLLRECLQIRRQTLPEDDWQVAGTESILAACLTELGHYEEAERLLLDSYPKLESECGLTDERTMDTLVRIVGLYQAWGRPELAAAYRARMATPGDHQE